MRRPTKACPFCETPRPLRRLQGRAHPRPLHHRSRQDPAEPPERRVRAASASAEHRDQARALPRADSVHAGSAGLTCRTPRPRRRPSAGGGSSSSRSRRSCSSRRTRRCARCCRSRRRCSSCSRRSPRAVSWAGGPEAGCCSPSSGSGSPRGCSRSPRVPGSFYNLVRGWSLLLAGCVRPGLPVRQPASVLLARAGDAVARARRSCCS